jgi:hypothetical protein
MRGGTGGGDRGSPGVSVGGIFAGASWLAPGCWNGVGGWQSNRGGCSRGDGSVNEWEAQDAVAGSWRAALGSSVVDVEGGSGRAWSTGRRGFRWAYGGGDDVVVCMREEVAQATSPVEGWVQGAGVDGLFDSMGHLVAFPGKVGDVFWAEVVVSGVCVLAYGGGVLVGEGQFGLVVVLPQSDVHGALRLADVGG